MKIGFVLDDSLDPADGVQQYVLALGRWLTDQGHDVHYLVGHTKRDDVPQIHSLGRTLSVRFNQNRMATPLPVPARKIRELLAREQFDVLHVQMPYSPLLAAKVIAQASPQTAVVGTFHVLPYSRRETAAARVLRLVLRPTLKRFDQILSVSPPAADFARQTFHVESEVLPNVVTVATFQKGRKLAKYADGKLNIVYLGRLVKRKGCQQLLRTLVRLQHRGMLKQVRVVIVGKGPERPHLERFVRGHKLDDVVEFVGFVAETDKPDYLASADIVVLPSTGGESFGIVLVEAMAAGADVVVAGDNSGYRSVLGSAKEQLVNPNDTTAFAATLEYFLKDKTARRRAQKWQAGQVTAYDVRTVGPKLVKIYTQVLRSRRAREIMGGTL